MYAVSIHACTEHLREVSHIVNYWIISFNSFNNKINQENNNNDFFKKYCTQFQDEQFSKRVINIKKKKKKF